ncbi:MAG: ABC transporter permease [Vicinamibacteria bacterium]|nr:ABC transporter permease [Vicinamibacteria bacterium]
MGAWRSLSGLFRRRRAFEEAREELRFHVEMLVAEKRRAGLPEHEARRQARLELGDVEPCAEALAERQPGAGREAWARDLRHAARRLRRAPGFSLAAAGLLALGIGASTAIFTLVDQALLRPLPYPRPESIVRLFETSEVRGVARTGVSRGNLAAWRREARSFESLALGYVTGRTLSGGGGDAEVLATAQVSCDFFPLLGVAARHGRTFHPDECHAATYSSAAAPTAADPVVVLSHGLWQRRFGGDPGVVGRTVVLERRPFRVIGVLGAPLDLPEPGVEAFLPWELERSLPRDQRYTVALGRLRHGTELAAARHELQALAAAAAAQYPETNAGWSVELVPLHEAVSATARPALLALLAAAFVLLLVACGNAALLFLARGAARAREAALRLALGAPRGRVLREGLLEGLLVATAGGVAGLALAAALVHGAGQAWPELPRAAEIQLDGSSFVFALLAASGAAALAAAGPAWRVACGDPRAAFEAGARTTHGPERSLRSALVVAEVALSVVLLTGGSLLWRTVHELRETPIGFEARGVWVAPVFLDSTGYPTGAQTRDYYARLLARLRALPGVVAAGAATTLPTSGVGPDFARPVWPAGLAGSPTERAEAWVRMLTPGYLETLGVPVVAGRGFGPEDGPDGPRVVAVSASLARRLWPGGDAVGRSLVVDYASAGTYAYQVVGVFGDVRFRGPRSEPLAEVFFPHAQRSYLIMNVAVRAADGAAPAAAIRQVFRELDPHKPPQSVHALEDLLGASYRRERRAMELVVAFGACAAGLCGLGLHGLLALGVVTRQREIAVRIALGAGRLRLVRGVAGEAVALVVAGAGLGVLLAIGAAPLLGGLLYGVSPADPAAIAASGAALAAVAVASAAGPAWRAAGLEPARLLRRD